MRAVLCFAGLFAVAISAAGHVPMATAGETSSWPPLQTVQYVFDCQGPRALPSQRSVGEWTGQHNFSQVYATRRKLMADVDRACHKAGVGTVRLVREAQPAGAHPVRRQVAGAATPHR